MNYKDSGVDIKAGREFVERLMRKAPAIGGFGGMVRVPTGYEKPILVSGTDGVGTKLNICMVANDYTTIGIDLVAMCVNDIITCGAEPLYFLDYISCKKLDDRIDPIMEGILKGCDIAEIDLLGGETAEHGRFAKDYDLAGFCTGIVEESQIIDGRLIKPGDKVIGIESSGLHSNGYSLINDMLWRHKLFYEKGYDDALGDPSATPELLTPTTIYAPLVKHLLDEVDYNSWPMPKIFSKVMLAGEIPEEEMKNVFNLGIGYCLVVPDEAVIDTQLIIEGNGLQSWVIAETK